MPEDLIERTAELPPPPGAKVTENGGEMTGNGGKVEAEGGDICTIGSDEHLSFEMRSFKYGAIPQASRRNLHCTFPAVMDTGLSMVVAVAWSDLLFFYTPNPSLKAELCAYGFWMMLTVLIYPVLLTCLIAKYFPTLNGVDRTKKSVLASEDMTPEQQLTLKWMTQRHEHTGETLKMGFGTALGLGISYFVTAMEANIIGRAPGMYVMSWGQIASVNGTKTAHSETISYAAADASNPLRTFTAPISPISADDTVTTVLYSFGLDDKSKIALWVGAIACLVLFVFFFTFGLVVFLAFIKEATTPDADGEYTAMSGRLQRAPKLVVIYLNTFSSAIISGLYVPFAKPWYYLLSYLIQYMFTYAKVPTCEFSRSSGWDSWDTCHEAIGFNLIWAICGCGICYGQAYLCKATIYPEDSPHTKTIKNFYNSIGMVLVGYTVTGLFFQITKYTFSKALDDSTYMKGNCFMWLYAILFTVGVVLYVKWYCDGDYSPKDPWKAHVMEVNAWLLAYAYWYPFEAQLIYLAYSLNDMSKTDSCTFWDGGSTERGAVVGEGIAIAVAVTLGYVFLFVFMQNAMENAIEIYKTNKLNLDLDVMSNTLSQLPSMGHQSGYSQSGEAVEMRSEDRRKDGAAILNV